MQFQDDHLIQATAADATIRLLAAITTNLVSEACQKHRTTPTASAALGRTLTGALLLGRTLKDLERLTLRFDCQGAIGGITAEASAHGTVRGYVRNPLAHAEPVAPGKLNVKGITVPGYAAAKGGVAQLTKALANEWAARGINVNAIAPGYMRTDNTEALQRDETRNRQIVERIPAGRWGEPNEVAGAAVFLCSAASAYVHGHVLVVDGGWMGR